MEGFGVLALDIPHGGGRTFGFRVWDGSATVAYLSDHSPVVLGPGNDGFGALHDAALALADGVDLLIHDSQHTAEEFPAKAFLGHSSVEYAIGLARAANARRLLLFHHDPDRTDDEIDALVAAHRARGLTVEAAAEGSEIQL
jgi:phosphoribosyl 1,2-cyclic phosphodiesterase